MFILTMDLETDQFSSILRTFRFSRSRQQFIDFPLPDRNTHRMALAQPATLLKLAERAGLSGAELQRFWPERQRLIWSPPL